MYANCQYIMSIKQTEIGTIHEQILLSQVKKMLLKLVMERSLAFLFMNDGLLARPTIPTK
jgi:hypothetical protein